MKRWNRPVWIALLVPVVSTMLGGCSSSTSPPPPAAPVASQLPDAPPQAGATDSGNPSQDSQIAAALAKLSDEDRQLAMAQKTCPVSDQPLGSMDAPVKVNVNGRDVFICCAGCEDSLKAEADKYLAKLPAAAPK